MEFLTCIGLHEAIHLITGKLSTPAAAAEDVDIADCLGRIAAEDVVAKEDLPSFNRSTVDGFAVNSADTFGASESVPALLSIAGEVLMGQQISLSLRPGQAVAIPTGGMLPAGADAVVMVECTEQLDAQSVLVVRPLAPGENVITRGEDITAGNVILRRGQKIAPRNIGALAACGFKHVPVSRKLPVAILATGDEVVDIDCAVGSGQVRDINSYTISAILQEAGCAVLRYGIIPDRFEALKLAISQALETCRMIVVSGGSSVGTRDHTVRVIQSFENSGVLLHGVAVKPGKPTIFGMIRDIPVFGLPGHPASAITICEELVKPAAVALMGLNWQEDKYRLPARLTRSVASAPGRDDFVRVQLFRRNGEYWAAPLFGKSGLVSTIMQADGIVHIAAEKSGLYKNEWVDVELIG